MHTKFYVEPRPPFQAGRFTPGVSLVEGLPHGVDADVLVLGSGDMRDVLYTAFADKGLPERKIDFTICDENGYTIARNVFFLTLVLDGDKAVTINQLWDIYYEVWLLKSDIKPVTDQLEKLVDFSSTPEAWRDSPYGSTLRFSEDYTLSFLHGVWGACAKYAAVEDPEEVVRCQNLFGQSLKMSNGIHELEKYVSKQDVSRSCAPLAAQVADEMVYTTERHWDKTVRPARDPEAYKHEFKTPNPIFFLPMTTAPSTLQYPTNPFLSFHMAAAEANLTPSSPFYLGRLPSQNSDETCLKWRYAAMIQFQAWIDAFAEAAPRLTVRFSAADHFSFCHTLRFNLESGDLCAQHYRANHSFDLFALSEEEYGTDGTAPRQFDVIDTSTLAGQVSPVNLLVSTSGLLKDKPSSTIYTTNYQRMGHEDDFEAILAGDTTKLSILLGLAPLEYWTNARAMSPADQVLTVWTEKGTTAQGRETLFNYRISWKHIKHIVGAGTGTVPITPKAGVNDIVQLVLKVYRHMYGFPEVTPSAEKTETGAIMPRVLAKYSPRMQHTAASFAAFVDAVCYQAQVDPQLVWEQLLLRLLTDPDSPKPMRESVMVFISRIRPHLRSSYLPTPSPEPLTPTMSYPWDKWSVRPEQLAITFTVPTSVWNPLRFHPGPRLFRERTTSIAAFLAMPDTNIMGDKPVRSVCDDIQVAFGTISDNENRDAEDFALTIEEEPETWRCGEHMIVSFYLATDIVERYQTSSYSTVGFFAQPLRVTPKGYIASPGYEKPSYVIALNDRKKVFITKHRPDQESREVSEHLLRQIHKEGRVKEERKKEVWGRPEPFAVSLMANFNDAKSKIETITAHVDVKSDPGRRLLADKACITITQTSPFALQLTIGTTETAVCTVFFPAPILKSGSKTRIVRTSGYIEIIAPLVDIRKDYPAELDTFFLPTAPASPSSPPVALSIHNLNLDSLPSLSLEKKDRISFITTFAAFMFSPRERKLRQQRHALEKNGQQSVPSVVQRPGAGAGVGAGSNSPFSARLAFKESLLAMFMLASGLLGGQTGLFALTDPGPARGVHMLLFVSAIRLDSAGGGGGGCGGVVLDAAVLPFTREMVEGTETGDGKKKKDSELEEFLLLLRSLDCCTLKVNAEELVLWKTTLPALAERCRTWMHREDTCEYLAAGGKVPLSVVEGEHFLCSCGQGHFPKDFLQIPGWDTAAAAYATRVAISPVYASALVEELIDQAVAEKLAEKLVNFCRHCRKPGTAVVGDALVKCGECKDVRYCSGECRQADWSKHKLECANKRIISFVAHVFENGLLPSLLVDAAE